MAMIKTTNEFNETIAYYKNILKEGYEEAVGKASNKTYAKQHFQQLFFIENEYIPHHTLLFKELKFVYYHFNALDSSTSFEKTSEHLSKIRVIASTELEKLISFHNDNRSIDISDHYFNLIHNNKVKIEELIAQETLALESTDENLVGTLAISIAGKQLFVKYNLITEQQEEKDDAEIKDNSNHQYKFTQKQQLLALYFLLESFGIKNLGTVDLTKQAALYHLIMGVPFNDFKKIKNNNIYKSLRNAPQVVASDKHLLKNLELIRPYFEAIQLINVVELIDKHIAICKENIEK